MPDFKTLLGHPAITFSREGDIDEQGLDGVLDATEMEAAAVLEIANNLDVAHVMLVGRTDEGILVIERTDIDGLTPAMPYEAMFVYKNGRIAEAMTNNPVRHRSFSEMVQDTRYEADRTAQS